MPAIRTHPNSRSIAAATISRAATSRGLSVETVEGKGFVVVRKVDEPRVGKSTQASSSEGYRRRGLPPKRQERDQVR